MHGTLAWARRLVEDRLETDEGRRIRDFINGMERAELVEASDREVVRIVFQRRLIRVVAGTRAQLARYEEALGAVTEVLVDEASQMKECHLKGRDESEIVLSGRCLSASAEPVSGSTAEGSILGYGQGTVLSDLWKRKVTPAVRLQEAHRSHLIITEVLSAAVYDGELVAAAPAGKRAVVFFYRHLECRWC